MVRDSNFAKCGAWAKRTVVVALLGAAIGAIFGLFTIRGDDALLVGALGGALMGAAVPGTVAAWFLLLHMLGQVAAAVRGDAKASRRKRREESSDA